jgi:hypothetical protein
VKREGRPGRAPHADQVRNDPTIPRRSVTSEDFCVCGWPFVGRGIRQCIGLDHAEPRRSLHVREADGRIVWTSVPEALARGGR